MRDEMVEKTKFLTNLHEHSLILIQPKLLIIY